MDILDNEKLFAIKLADNEKKVRDKAIQQLRSYISSRSNSNGRMNNNYRKYNIFWKKCEF